MRSVAVWALAAAFPLAASAQQQPAPPPAALPVPPPVPLPRTDSGITLDGDLSDPAWRNAATIDAFFETVFGDNREPIVKTAAYVMYDDKYFYVGLRCDDPDPRQIRAPYADRDQVIGTDDNVAIFLDTRGDRRSAQEFRVSPRGIQGDGVFNDANGNEDFSPDFYYDTAAKITDKGWTAEVRIPLTSLRYPKADPQKWGIIVWRNYPRAFRYAIYSSPIPRGGNCLICRSRELTDISRLPSSGHLVLAPYVSGQSVADAATPGDPLAPAKNKGEIGLDVKWNPSANTALDATVNPDFSQVEADVAQIAVNNRFALFFPEKRPFFLEGIDLFDTPIQAVYTRTIASPEWGARGTGKLGAASYTVLLTRDSGERSVILPGPTSSGLAFASYDSVVGVARLRRDYGQSFVGLLYSGRTIDGGGHNEVIGPDFQWRPNERDTLAGQVLISDTRTPDRPEVTAEWDGRKLTSHGAYATWIHSAQGIDWFGRYRDFGDDFRADEGFVPQVGYRQAQANVGYKFFPKGLLAFVHPFVFGEYSTNRDGDLINQRVNPGVNFFGRRNIQGELDLNVDRVLTGGTLLPRTQVAYFLQVDPSPRFTRIGLNGFVGEEIDVDNGRTGRGASVTAVATVRPTVHLTLDANSAISWLNVDDARVGSGRLFTAQVQRLKATYNFGPRMFVRLIGQYVTTHYHPERYTFDVPARDASFSGSALFSYRLNWQTALFVGYGDERALDQQETLRRTERQFFAKLSYAFQR